MNERYLGRFHERECVESLVGGAGAIPLTVEECTVLGTVSVVAIGRKYFGMLSAMECASNNIRLERGFIRVDDYAPAPRAVEVIEMHRHGGQAV